MHVCAAAIVLVIATCRCVGAAPVLDVSGADCVVAGRRLAPSTRTLLDTGEPADSVSLSVLQTRVSPRRRARKNQARTSFGRASPSAMPSLEQQRDIRSAATERLPSRLAADRGTYVDFTMLLEDPALVPEFNDTHFNPTVLVPSDTLVSNLTAALAAARPQFVVTIGTRSHFSYMESLPLQMRHGWTHFNGPDEFTARALESLYWHALHYPGGAPGEALVSVFTKAVSEEASLLTTYHSLLGQTHSNWEWLVYCDAWLDEKQSQSSWTLLKDLAASDYRVRPLKGSPNDGTMTCPERMMFGDANGELLAQVEAGGELLPHALALLSDAARDNSGAALFFGDHVHAGAAKNSTQFVTDMNTTAFALDTANGVGLYHELSTVNNSFPSWMTGCTLFSLTAETAKTFARKPGPFLAWRRPLYNALGGHASGLPLAADYELVMRMALRNYSAVHVRHLMYMPPPQNGGEALLTSSLTQRIVNAIAKNAVSMPGSRESATSSTRSAGPVSAHITDDNANNAAWEPFWDVWRPSVHPALATPWHLQASQAATRPDAPFISIVISTYDRADALLHAIRSVYAQTYRNWELVIVGDGCPKLDEFMNEHASFFAHAGHRVRWFNMYRHKNGPGGHAPRNYAVQVLASGAWIAYLDDDNAWTHNHLASLVRLVRQDPACSFAFASLQIGSKVLMCDQPKLKRIDTSALLHRADLIERYGSWRPISDIPLGYGQDWDLVSRWLNGGELWAASLQPTVLYHSLRLQQGNMDEGSYADHLIRAYDAFRF